MSTIDFPGYQAAAAMLLCLVALYLFAQNRIPLQASCIAILLALLLGSYFSPIEYNGNILQPGFFLAGFSNEALLAICFLLILARGVEISGVLGPVGSWLARMWLWNRGIALLATLAITALLSAFVNNTPIVVMLLPVLVGVAHHIGIAPSRILMPAGFASIVGGMTTTIGSSTNLLVVAVAADLGVERIHMFDFFAPAACGAIVAILYLWLVAPKLVPDRQAPLTATVPRVFQATLELAESSALVNQTFADVLRQIGPKIKVTKVQRHSGVELVRLPMLGMRVGDRVSVRGTADTIKQAEKLFGMQQLERDVTREPGETLVELVVTDESPLFKKQLSDVQRVLLGRLTPIGLYRPGLAKTNQLDETPDPLLLTGDILLVQGKRADVKRLKEDPLLLILDRTVHVPRADKAKRASAIFIGVVLVAALGILPIMVSAFFGVALMLLTRCLAWDEVAAALDSGLVLIIVTSLALGSALSVTGAAEYLAVLLVSLVHDLPAPIIICSLLLLFSLLTEVVTNNAVAVIGTPIAVGIAQELGLPELPFVLAVLFGANMSYIMPIGYQTNLLVMGAGGYRFSDFFRVGIPLQVLLWLTLSAALTVWYL
jgi:di/tricarboxylate transporter